MATAVLSSAETLQPPFPAIWSLADLQEHLGGIPAERIRMFPPPGYATEEDVIVIEAHENRLFELKQGILVEKPMGWYESMLAVIIIGKLQVFLEANDLGKVLGADGTLKILPDTVKIPDVSFISWDRWPKEKLPRRPIPSIAPDLAVEVLSETNTPAEMDAKLDDYFRAGVRLVWYIDPTSRTARSFTSSTDVVQIDTQGVLDGGNVLPGFVLSLQQLFEHADRQGPAEQTRQP